MTFRHLSALLLSASMLLPSLVSAQEEVPMFRAPLNAPILFSGSGTPPLEPNDPGPQNVAPAFTPLVVVESRTVGDEWNATPTLTSAATGVTWSISPALPTGISFSSSTGAISGSFSAASAAQDYLLKATNSVGTQEQTFSLAVYDPVTLTADAITGSAPMTVNQQLAATGGKPGYVYSWDSGSAASVPGWLSLSSSGLLSGTAATFSGDDLRINVVDSENRAGFALLDITITAPPQWYVAGNGFTKTFTASPTFNGFSGLAISATGGTYCGTKNGSDLWCWGGNGQGQVGDNTQIDRATPVAIYNNSISAFSPALAHSCAARSDGQAVCWGYNATRQSVPNSSTTRFLVATDVPGATSATQVVGGRSHSCALISNGSVKCWGQGSSGQIGHGSAPATVTSPTLVKINAGTNLSGVTQLVAGEDHTCALSSGSVYCWGGHGGYGEIGDGAATQRNFATLVSGLSGVTKIASKMSHTCAITGGAVKCWGRNAYGQIGNGQNISGVATPQPFGNLTGVTDIAVGYYHTCAVAGGKVYCSGMNSDGQLGYNGADSNVPVQVTGITTATKVVAGGHTTLIYK